MIISSLKTLSHNQLERISSILFDGAEISFSDNSMQLHLPAKGLHVYIGEDFFQASGNYKNYIIEIAPHLAARSLEEIFFRIYEKQGYFTVCSFPEYLGHLKIDFIKNL